MHKVGVIGSGVVGQTLARGFKTHGHDVRIASRTPAKLAEFSSSAGIPAATFAEAAAWADLIVLAVHGAGAEEALGLAGADNLRGKIVIDTTNPISDQAPVDGVLQFFTGPNSSLLERLQAAYPQARFVKAFNSVGSARMVNPLYRQGKPTMFHCGNDAEAVAVRMTTVERSPWSDPLTDVRVSRRGGWLYRDGTFYRVPVKLAARIRGRLSLR